MNLNISQHNSFRKSQVTWAEDNCTRDPKGLEFDQGQLYTGSKSERRIYVPLGRKADVFQSIDRIQSHGQKSSLKLRQKISRVEPESENDNPIETRKKIDLDTRVCRPDLHQHEAHSERLRCEERALRRFSAGERQTPRTRHPLTHTSTYYSASTCSIICISFGLSSEFFT